MSELAIALSSPVVRPVVTNFVRAAVTGAVVAATSPATSSLLLVGGAYLAVGAAYYLWTEAQKKAIQNKAKEKYIAANQDSDVAGTVPFQGGQSYHIAYQVSYKFYQSSTVTTNHTTRIYGDIAEVFAKTTNGISYNLGFRCRGYVGMTPTTDYFDFNPHNAQKFSDGRIPYLEITNIVREDGKPDTGGNPPKVGEKPWEQWTTQQKTDAVNNLSDSDWFDAILNMPQSGTLERGQSLPNSILLTGNPTSDYEIDRESRVVPANTQVPTLFKDQPITNTPDFQDLRDRVKNLEPLVLGLPVAAAVATAARVPNLAQIQSATETATCSAIKGDTCSGSPIPRMNNNIGDMNKKLDALTQAGQGALLVTMNNTLNGISSVLGTKIHVGGISGALGRFMSSSIVDRTLNLVTAAGVIHNCLMLSTSIQDTFFGMLDNIVAIPSLIKDPDGATIDTKEIFSKHLDSVFSGLFGAEEWKAIKVQWAAYSTIARTASNMFSSVRDIIDETSQIQTTTKNWVAQLGNGLTDEGVIGEDNWDYKDPNQRPKGKYFGRLERIREGAEKVENVFEDLEQVTSSVRSIVETANEIKENANTINKAIDDANKAAQKDRDTKVEGLELPNFSLDDLF